MATYQNKGVWRFRKQWTNRAGKLIKISGTPLINSKKAAELAERKAIEEAEDPKRKAAVTTFAEYWADRYMPDWCGPENRPGTVAEKRSIYKHHLGPALGQTAVADITTEAVQKFKASLGRRKNRYGKPIGPKTVDNVLAVLSHAMAYAEEIELIEKAPKVRLNQAERPEPEPLTFSELDRFLDAAREKSPAAYLAALLASDAGLRLGEIFMVEGGDINLTAGLLRVDESRRKGTVGKTKSGRVRHVPLTPTLAAALAAAPKHGPTVLHQGRAVSETYLKHVVYGLCEAAGLKSKSWHRLRHTYATHAARLGVSPWALQSWLGHSTVGQSEKYVTLAKRMHEEIPAHVLAAGSGIADPDRRVLAMLGARSEARFATGLQPVSVSGDFANDNDKVQVGGTGIEPATLLFGVPSDRAGEDEPEPENHV